MNNYSSEGSAEADSLSIEESLAQLPDLDKYKLVERLAGDLGIPAKKLSCLFIEYEAHPNLVKGSLSRAEFLWLQVCRELGYSTSVYPNNKEELFNEYVSGEMDDSQFTQKAKHWLESVRSRH